MDGISSEPQTRYTNEIPSIATSHCHTLRNGPHECPIRQFAALEIPQVPDVLQTVLSTTCPLDNTALQSLSTNLNAARFVFESIEECIATTQAILRQMQSAKDSCALSIKKYEAAIHPIHSLPDDILLAIFHWHILLEPVARIRYNAISVDRSPWTLSRVSRRWRALALSSPLLWSDISVHSRLIAKSRYNFEMMVQRWNLLLERSADCDLRVLIIGGNTTYDTSLAEIVLLLMPTTSRWKSVEIASTSISVLAPLATRSFERLSEIIWRCDPQDSDSNVDEPPVVSSVFRSASNIECLVLQGPIKVDLQWDRIRQYISDFHGIQYLRNLTSLDCLCLNLTPPEDMTPMRRILPRDSEPIFLPHLRTLSMKESSGRFPYIRQISQLLHIPSLTTLVINSEKTPLPAFPSPLPLLRNLSIGSFKSSSKISVFLAAHSHITALSTGNFPILQRLQVAEGDTVLLPRLTSLHIDAKTLMIDAKTVLSVMESRCGDDRRGGDVARLATLFIMGPESSWHEAETLIKKKTALWERWTALSAKITVIRTDSTVW